MSSGFYRFITAAGAFLLVCGFFAAVSWAAGFDFDHRNYVTGEVTMWALLFASVAAVAAWCAGKGTK